MKNKFVKYTLGWYIKEISIIFFFFFHLCECIVGCLKVMRDTGPSCAVWASPARWRTCWHLWSPWENTSYIPHWWESVPHDSKKSSHGTVSTPWELACKSFSITLSTLVASCSLASFSDRLKVRLVWGWWGSFTIVAAMSGQCSTYRSLSEIIEWAKGLRQHLVKSIGEGGDTTRIPSLLGLGSEFS